MRALIYLVLGVVLTALGVWWIGVAGDTPAAIVAGLVTAIGGFLVVVAMSIGLDIASPTSKKN